MSKVLLILAILFTGIGLLVFFAPVNDAYNSIATNYIKPITDNTTGYVAAGGTPVPNYNGFDWVVMNNLWLVGVALIIGALFYAASNVFKGSDADNV